MHEKLNLYNLLYTYSILWNQRSFFESSNPNLNEDETKSTNSHPGKLCTQNVIRQFRNSKRSITKYVRTTMSIHRTFTRQQTERILGIHKGSSLAWLKGSNPESNTGGAYLFGIFLRFFPTESVRRVREWIERGAKVKSGFHFNSIRLSLLVRLANATQRWVGSNTCLARS